MANVTITSLPAAGAITGAESVPIVQNGVTVQTTTGAIAASPSQTQTFLTLVNEPTLPNSQRISTGTGLTSTTTGAQGQYTLAVTGAPASLIASPTGIQVKTNATTLTGVQIAVGANLSVANADGTTGDPTVSLSGLISNIASMSGTGLVAVGSGLASAVTITGTAGQIAVANGNGSGGSPTASLIATAVTPGSYLAANVTVDTYGRITSASSGTVVSSFSAGSTGLLPSTATGGAVTLSGTLNIANGGTGATTLAGASIATYTGTETLTNKRIPPRIVSVASASPILPTGNTADQYEVTALAASVIVAAPTGTPTDGQTLILRIIDNGTARALTWTTSSGGYRAIGTTLPTTTVISKTVYIGCIYNSTDTVWDVVAVAQQA